MFDRQNWSTGEPVKLNYHRIVNERGHARHGLVTITRRMLKNMRAYKIYDRTRHK